MQSTKQEAEVQSAPPNVVLPGPARDRLDWIKVAEGVQAVLTSVAIVVGGAWAYWEFVVTREDFTKANSAHVLHVLPLGEDQLLVRVAVTITNQGTRVIRPDYGEIRLQQILPLANCPDPCPRTLIAAGEDPVQEGERGVRWPLLRHRANIVKGGELRIEPGESDTVEADFVIPRRIKAVQAYSFFSDRGAEDLGWRLSTIHPLNEEESTP